MKRNIGRMLFAVCSAVLISGCQQPAVQTENQTVSAEVKQPKAPLQVQKYELAWSHRGSVEEIFDVCESVFDDLVLM